MTRLEEFEQLRSLLFAISYRILGSMTEAEDAVQEAWLRWDATTTRPASTKAFLSATVTRISIDLLRSARVRRETYPGPWLPEPVLDEPYHDPERAAELADSLSTAALVLLERLSPLERAVFVLHDVFGFGFVEIAATVDRSVAACKQLAVRARCHMAEGRPRFTADRTQRDVLAARFVDASRRGDVDELKQLLADDVQAMGDAGGKAPALVHAVSGSTNVARVLVKLFPALDAIGATVEQHRINGQPGAVVRDRAGRIINTFTLDILAGRIQTILFVLSPDKLGHLGEVADPWAVADAARAAMRGRY